MNGLLELGAALLAAIIIMILHELPKSLVYRFRSKNEISYKSILNVIQYIDPIGLVFCVITKAGFSKPFQYKFESRKRAIVIGMTGYACLLVYFLIGLVVYRFLFTGVDIEEMLVSNEYSIKFTYWFVCFFILNSMGMLVTSLFPIASFNMGLCIAGVSLHGFISIIRRDTLMKVALFIVLYVQAIPITIIKAINYFYETMIY